MIAGQMVLSGINSPPTEVNKNTTQYVMDTTMRKQRQITYIRHAPLSNNWR
jgi:hypothetical protein